MLNYTKMFTNTAWGDCVDTIKHNKSLKKWYDVFEQLNYNVFRLPEVYSFNVVEMQEQIKNITETHPTLSIIKNSSGTRFSKYRGLGFHARRDSANPIFDHFTRRDKKLGVVYGDDLHLKNDLPELIEDDFTEPTEILNPYFKKVFSVFKSHITKASILELRSGGWLGSHVDFPYYQGIRLHSTISGGESAWYEVAGEKFQIPADGHWYFIDTGKYHSVYNYGPTHRTTLNINLNVYFDKKMTKDPKSLAQAGLL